MSYDLSFDRKTATLLAICTASMVVLLLAAGFLLGAQYRQAANSQSAVPTKASPTPAAQKIEPPATTTPIPVEASTPSEPTSDSMSDPQVDTPAKPLAAAKSVSAKVPVVVGYSLQFGAFREEGNAEAAVKQLQDKKVKAEVVPKDDAAGNTWYTVRFGNYPTLSAASAAAVPLRASTQQSIFVRPANRP